MEPVDRRGFLIRSGGALVAVPLALHVVACGEGTDDYDEADGAPPPTGEGEGFQGATADNSGHAHSVVLLCADLDADGATYTSSSSSGHAHEVTLTAVQLGQLANGERITFQTTDLHPHTWFIQKPASSCA